MMYQTARLIERIRVGDPPDSDATAAAVRDSREAAVTLGLGPDHADPRDVELATDVDAFDFAIQAARTPAGLQLRTLRFSTGTSTARV